MPAAVIADPAGAQPRHGRRQPRPRRPGQRPPGGRCSPSAPRSWRSGRRASATIPIDDFFIGPFVTALGPDEILDGDPHPAAAARSGRRLPEARAQGRRLRDGGRRRPDHPGGRRRCTQAGIGLTNVGPTPIKAPSTPRRSCRASRRTTRRSREAARLAAGESDPSADLRGSVEYKRDLVRVPDGAGAAARARARGAERRAGRRRRPGAMRRSGCT